MDQNQLINKKMEWSLPYLYRFHDYIDNNTIDKKSDEIAKDYGFDKSYFLNTVFKMMAIAIPYHESTLRHFRETNKHNCVDK